MYNWRYDEASSRAVYEQIADYFRDLMESGELVHGQTLLSQRDYCTIFNVSRPTIERAFEILKRDKLISLEPKKKAVVMRNSDHTSSVNWHDYTDVNRIRGYDKSLQELINVRSSSNIMNLYECYFGEGFYPYKPVKEAIELAVRHMPPYYHHSNLDIRGTMSLRQAICSHVAKYGIFADPSQVLVCNSLQNAYTMLFKAIGSRYVDCYLEEESVFTAAGNITGFNYICLPMDEEGILPVALEEQLKSRHKGFLTIDTNHSMPGGITYSLSRRKQIMKLSAKYRLPIIESEVVRDCWHETPPLPSLKSMDLYQNVVHVFALARPFMPVPMSAIIAPEPLMPVLMDLKVQNDDYTDIISQNTLEKLLTHNIYNDYMDSVRPLIIEKRDETEKLLHKHFNGVAHWKKPDRGVNWRINFDFNISPLFTLLERDGIILYPPAIFSSSKNFIWFCYTGLESDKLDYAFSRIAHHIKNFT